MNQNDAHIIIFDTETTGREKSTGPAAVIEAAWLALSALTPSHLSGSQVDEYCERFNPSPVAIEWGAIATHHILPHELEMCAPSSLFALPPSLGYMIGHNIDYDWKVAGEPDVRRICTLALSRWLWPDLDGHTQSALFYWLHSGDQRSLMEARDTLRNAHSALVDVKICRFILQAQINTLIQRGIKCETWLDLWEISENARIPTVIGFGKHKGDKFADLPPSYKQWLLKQDDLDPYVRIAAQGGRVTR